jgi:hypothetical protein
MVERNEYNHCLMWKIIRYLFIVSLLLLSLILLVWSFFPYQHKGDVQVLVPRMMAVEFNEQINAAALLENRQVKLEWPSFMRIGDQGVILMDFVIREEPWSSYSQTNYSDAYDSYNMMVEAKFEVSGLRVDPLNPTRVSMPPGQPLQFKWKIIADEIGTYVGNVWLSLRFLPLDGSTAIQVPIYVKEINIQSTSLFGLSDTMAQLAGGIGIMLSLLLILNEILNGWKKKYPEKIIEEDVRDMPQNVKDL